MGKEQDPGGALYSFGKAIFALPHGHEHSPSFHG